jgi:hypothetical protein
VIAFGAGAVWRIKKWFLGQAEPGTPTVREQLLQTLRPRRLSEFIRATFFQSRLAPDRFSLLMHQTIFWGMAILFIGTALATMDQDVTNLLFDSQMLSGGFYKLFEFALDLFGIILIVGVGMAAYRRYVQRPPRLQAMRAGISFWDAFPFLRLLLLITVTGFLVEGLRLAEGFHIDARIAMAGSGVRRDTLEAMGLRERFHVGRERQDAQLNRIAAGGPVFPLRSATAWRSSLRHCRSIRSAACINCSGGCTRSWHSV